ncbi:MAG TPA: C13 family peptidase [Candidatus Acidoferrum sp.]|nr:C13 family peptidase [Candidatus Acidoferrum sp.]
MYLDHRLYEKGETIGPAFQKIVCKQASILVFADDAPLANFGHDCRYLLYDANTGSLHSEIPARFPPFLRKRPETLLPFHEPVSIDPNPALFRIPPILRCPIIRPDGNRYAILYSGMSNMRHLNDLEFCYRMLVDRYGFDKKNIWVLNYDGTLNTQDGAAGTWPGDGTAYRIKVTGQGNRAAFQGAFASLKTRLKAHDLLFIHTNNHGDNYGSGSFLCEYPSWGQYMASDFCTDLATLPKYRSLIAMMEQCNAGGFNAPVVAASTAQDTSIASAAIATQSSWASPDGHWDSFARDWIAAQIGHDPYGAALAHNPDTDGDGVIEAEEAFNYALSVQNPSDSPNFSESSEAGGDITLGQRYVIWWWWCWIILPILEKYYKPVPPDPEFYAKVQQVLPELQKLIVPVLDRNIAGVRKELAPRIEAAIRAAFEGEDR